MEFPAGSRTEENDMPDHTIFNERPESQDRALKVIERLGYTIVPRSEAEQLRG